MKYLALISCLTLVAACGDDNPSGDPDAVVAGEPDAALPAPTFTARIRGPLANPDLAASKAYHDGVAMHSQAAANAAGDFAHQVGLGTADLGTTADEWLAIDQWRTPEAAQGFYGSADFQAALGPLLATPPEVQLFERHLDWKGWGDLGAGRALGQPFWFVTVQGRLKQADLDANHTAHDTIAAAGEVQARAAGDVAHLPHLAVGDDREFFNVDIWSNEQNMLATFNDPDFRAGLLSLFDSPPDVRVYSSTDWYQWYQP